MYLKINKLTHNDMKVLFPDIKRTSFDNLERNSSLIYKGEIILVHDCNGYILPYIRALVNTYKVSNIFSIY